MDAEAAAFAFDGLDIAFVYDIAGDEYELASAILTGLAKDSTLKTTLTGSSPLTVTVTMDSEIDDGLMESAIDSTITKDSTIL